MNTDNELTASLGWNTGLSVRRNFYDSGIWFFSGLAKIIFSGY
jgi:hypothetical protein